jgi:hypothetical protein
MAALVSEATSQAIETVYKPMHSIFKDCLTHSELTILRRKVAS